MPTARDLLLLTSCASLTIAGPLPRYASGATGSPSSAVSAIRNDLPLAAVSSSSPSEEYTSMMASSTPSSSTETTVISAAPENGSPGTADAQPRLASAPLSDSPEALSGSPVGASTSTRSTTTLTLYTTIYSGSLPPNPANSPSVASDTSSRAAANATAASSPTANIKAPAASGSPILIYPSSSGTVPLTRTEGAGSSSSVVLSTTSEAEAPTPPPVARSTALMDGPHPLTTAYTLAQPPLPYSPPSAASAVDPIQTSNAAPSPPAYTYSPGGDEPLTYSLGQPGYLPHVVTEGAPGASDTSPSSMAGITIVPVNRNAVTITVTTTITNAGMTKTVAATTVTVIA